MCGESRGRRLGNQLANEPPPSPTINQQQQQQAEKKKPSGLQIDSVWLPRQDEGKVCRHRAAAGEIGRVKSVSGEDPRPRAAHAGLFVTAPLPQNSPAAREGRGKGKGKYDFSEQPPGVAGHDRQLSVALCRDGFCKQTADVDL